MCILGSDSHVGFLDRCITLNMGPSILGCSCSSIHSMLLVGFAWPGDPLQDVACVGGGAAP